PPTPGPSPTWGGEKEAPVIGYLARVCHDKGLHLLVDACERLAGSHDFELHAAGYLGAADRAYLSGLEKRAAAGPLAGRFRYLGELDRAAKLDFLRGVTLFSTPTVYRESKGLPALEALAAGTPVVLPDHGGFPELVAESGGGLLHRPKDPVHLAERLAALLDNPSHAASLGETGRGHVHQHRNDKRMAESTLRLYRTLLP
ncbi:MAG: glycosyltransferase family 4 protein, partial [Planctomycetota bacterium]